MLWLSTFTRSWWYYFVVSSKCLMAMARTVGSVNSAGTFFSVLFLDIYSTLQSILMSLETKKYCRNSSIMLR